MKDYVQNYILRNIASLEFAALIKRYVYGQGRNKFYLWKYNEEKKRDRRKKQRSGWVSHGQLL